MRTFKFLIVGAFILVANGAYAQRDMILTQAGEEVRCRIIDETPVRFVFAYLKDGKPYRSEIFKNLVTSFKFNFYDKDLPNADKLPEAMYRATDGVDSQSPRSLSTSSKSTVSKRKKKKKKSKSEAEKVATDSDPLKEKDTNTLEKTEVVSTSPSTNQPSAQSNKRIERKNQKTESTTVASQPEQVRSGEIASTSSRQTEKKPKSPVNTTKKNETTEKRESVNVAAGEGGDIEAKSAEAKKILTESKTDTKPDISETELPNITINQKNKFRIGIKGGIGNRLDNNLETTNSFDLYQEQLLRGWTLGADLAYFPNDLFGFGIVYTDFQSRNSDGEILYRNEFTGAEQIGSIANKRSVKFVGPALFLRKKLDYKTYVVLGLSPGYNFYTDNGSYENVDYTFKGSGFGVASTLGIDFLLGNDIIGRDIILSFEAGYNYGQLNSLDYGDARGVVDLGTPIDLSRLDFTIGLRFIRFPKYFRLTSY